MKNGSVNLTGFTHNNSSCQLAGVIQYNIDQIHSLSNLINLEDISSAISSRIFLPS